MPFSKKTVRPRKPLTKNAFAAQSGFSRARVDKAIELGELRVVRFGGKDHIPPVELDRVTGVLEEPNEKEGAPTAA
jgi:hypothetical protein